MEEKNFFKDLKDSVRNAAERAGDKLDEWTDRGEERAEDAADRVKVAADRTGDKLQDWGQDARESAEEAGDRLSEDARDSWNNVERSTRNVGHDLDSSAYEADADTNFPEDDNDRLGRNTPGRIDDL